MPEVIRIAIIDDHPLLRDGVAGTLRAVQGMEIVALGSSAADAIRIAGEFHPDIALLDVSMPGGGIEAARSIAASHPDVRMLMLTVSEREEDIIAAMEAGARGYVLKGVTGPDLIDAVRSIARGELYITPQIAARALSRMQRQSPLSGAARNQMELTVRETQILAEVAKGLTNKEIARHFELSEKTIKHYMTNILQKLQVRNRVEAVLAHHKSGGRTQIF